MKLAEVHRRTRKNTVIRALKEHGACPGALVWARGSEAKTAEELWLACSCADWLTWLCMEIGSSSGANAVCAVVDQVEIEAEREEGVCCCCMCSDETNSKALCTIRAQYESPWLL